MLDLALPVSLTSLGLPNPFCRTPCSSFLESRVTTFVEDPILIVLVVCPLLPLCLKSAPPTSIVLNILPDVDLSFHLNLIDIVLPSGPSTISFLLSLENLAVTPGSVDSIFNSELSSNPSLALSSNSIILPLFFNLYPKDSGLSKLYVTGISTLTLFDVGVLPVIKAVTS